MEIYAETAMGILDELHTERLDYHSEYVPLADAINRLATYEETGLSPEEIERILDSYGRGMTLRTENAQRLEIIKEIPINRLRELAQARQPDESEPIAAHSANAISEPAIVLGFIRHAIDLQADPIMHVQEHALLDALWKRWNETGGWR